MVEPPSRDTAPRQGAGPPPFPFVGGSLAIDLVNTEPVVRGKPRDLLDGPGGYAAWWRAALAQHPAPARDAPIPAADLDDPALLPAAKALRTALRRLFAAVAAGDRLAPDALAVLNRVLAVGYPALHPAADGPRAVHKPRQPGPDAALLPVALSALELLTASDPARLHRCANDRCVLLFVDTTKSATRRWCSVACMNRARSAARHQARQRSTDPAVETTPGVADPEPRPTAPETRRRGATRRTPPPADR